MSARGPSATMRPFETAMPPSSITRRVWSIVTTVPPSTSKSTDCRRVWAVAFERMVISETQINANLFIGLFQESGIEGTRQKISDVKLLALPFEVREHDPRAARKLPDDLTTCCTRRCQSLGVCNNSHVRE